MACECSRAKAQTEKEQSTLRIALALNAAMFMIEIVAGFWAQSTGLMADALDMLADASAYGIALLAVTRGDRFKKNAARLSGAILLVLGLGIVIDVARRGMYGSEPKALVMMVFSLLSLAVNAFVLAMLSPFRQGEAHLRATWIFTRADVLANLAVFVSGLLVSLTGLRTFDLMVGLAIGLFVMREATEILAEANRAGN